MASAFDDVPWATAGRVLLARTCLACGEFKSAKEYSKNSEGYWYPQCKGCANTATNARYRARNQTSQKKATKAGTAWTPSDISKMWEMHEAGKPNQEIAEVLGRSLHAVAVKISRG